MRGYTGTIAGVAFEDGRPVEDQPEPRAGTLRAILGYVQRHGLVATDDGLMVREAGDPDLEDHPAHVRVGTPLQDAAEGSSGEQLGDSDGGIADSEKTEAPEPVGEPPAKSAKKADWEAYAVARGFLDDPGDLTKAELVERFGGEG